tara:strand:+ start:509 stop:685 length:177 start_codon:yes stop_codon:yes gene_type:complete
MAKYNKEIMTTREVEILDHVNETMAPMTISQKVEHTFNRYDISMNRYEVKQYFNINEL